MVQPASGDLAVGRIQPHRQIGHQHGGLAVLAAERVRNDGLRVLGHELPGAGRALLQLPLVAVEQFEIPVAPLGGRRGPDNLQPAGDGVLAHTATEAALPADELLLNRGGLRIRADQVGIAGAVGLTEAVSADDQRGGLLVVHRHPREGLADVVRGSQRIGLAVGAFRVDVDQTHLHRAQRIVQIALTAVALVAEPFLLRAPVDLLGLPDVGAAECEAERLEPHGFQCDVAGQHEQVGPGDLLAVLLLQRPQQPAGLVEVDVVRPGVQGSEALRALTGAAATVGDPVGAGGVPAKPDEETAVVPVVSRPPVLRLCHQ